MRMYGSQWESLAAAFSLPFLFFFAFFTASHVRIHINTTSHARIRIRYCKSCENPYQVQVLQVTRIVSEHAMKSKVRMINHYHHSAKLYQIKNITHLVPLAFLLTLCTRNNTNGNKLVRFSGIALYYGDKTMKV